MSDGPLTLWSRQRDGNWLFGGELEAGEVDEKGILSSLTSEDWAHLEDHLRLFEESRLARGDVEVWREKGRGEWQGEQVTVIRPLKPAGRGRSSGS